MRFEGTLKTWNDERGFGFIVPSQGGDDIFVHIRAYDRRVTPQVGQALTFEIELGPQGKKRARAVELRRIQPARTKAVRQERAAEWGPAARLAIPAFLAIYVMVTVLWNPPLWVAGVYLGMSVVALFAYAFDKSAAARGDWRTPEKTLHFLALACGWPGALLAQHMLRHKSSKPQFRAVFWLTVVANVGGFVLLFSPLGRQVFVA